MNFKAGKYRMDNLYVEDAMALWEAVLEMATEDEDVKDLLDTDVRLMREQVALLMPKTREWRKVYNRWFVDGVRNTDQSWDFGFCPWFVRNCVDWNGFHYGLETDDFCALPDMVNEIQK